ncbi:MerR family transcriptional regulator [Nakamurella sp. YIM 132084]|uniref:MerR family transcriptional regulator n=1 Tax=Nakamurella leprariae TaxID=2803911 RepID=A0A938Y6N3_9ACTN|nr:MerR family transcriptional regulator [Nakamurella leprariae]
MWISELSRVSGTPVPTIEYDLREGLLPAGEARSATRAAHDEGHVARLRLIRALVDVGGLPLQRVRDVLGVLDQPPETLHHLLGVAHTALAQPVATSDTGPGGPARPRAADVLSAARWTRVHPESPTVALLDRALDGLTAADLPVGDDVLRGCWEAAEDVARQEVSGSRPIRPRRSSTSCWAPCCTNRCCWRCAGWPRNTCPRNGSHPVPTGPAATGPGRLRPAPLRLRSAGRRRRRPRPRAPPAAGVPGAWDRPSRN